MIKFIIILGFTCEFGFLHPTDNYENELNKVASESKNSVKQVTLERTSLVNGWPSALILDYLGQVSGLSFCPKGFFYIFQRAGRRFNENSFNERNEYIDYNREPIDQDPILKINNRLDDPKIVKEFGSNEFYLPHGIFADLKYVWTTDLGRHQVIRIPHSSNEPDLAIGQKFVPGRGSRHLCKPTHAVSSNNGFLFVADGYCNSRILKFTVDGRYITQFADKGNEKVNIPHHLVLVESEDKLCVADRENRRVQCFVAGIKNNNETGKLIRVISKPEFGPIYAVEVNPKNGIYYILSGIDDEHSRSTVFLYDWKLDSVIGNIDYPGDYGFGTAHTLSVSPTGNFLAVGGLTKECPAAILTCLENEDPKFQLRNLWLYALMDSRVDETNEE